MVRVFDSGFWSHGFDPHTGHGSLLKLRQFHLPQFASVYSAANEYQHCWEDTCDGLASCRKESVQLHSKLLPLNETRFKHWPSLAFMAYLRHTVWGMTLPYPSIANDNHRLPCDSVVVEGDVDVVVVVVLAVVSLCSQKATADFSRATSL